jgi:hypothetical protein
VPLPPPEEINKCFGYSVSVKTKFAVNKMLGNICVFLWIIIIIIILILITVQKIVEKIPIGDRDKSENDVIMVIYGFITREDVVLGFVGLVVFTIVLSCIWSKLRDYRIRERIVRKNACTSGMIANKCELNVIADVGGLITNDNKVIGAEGDSEECKALHSQCDELLNDPLLTYGGYNRKLGGFGGGNTSLGVGGWGIGGIIGFLGRK